MNKRIIPKALRAILQPPAITGSEVNKKSAICSGSQVNYSKLGRYSYIGHDCFVLNATIGDFVSVADNCRIGGANHKMDSVSLSPVFHCGKNILKKNFASFQDEAAKETVIGADSWIGANSIVISGVNIGVGAVVGAGSVVTHDVPDYEIWAGNPARKIRDRFDSETVKALLELKWWDWSEDKIEKYADCFESPSALINSLEKNGENK